MNANETDMMRLFVEVTNMMVHLLDEIKFSTTKMHYRIFSKKNALQNDVYEPLHTLTNV